MEKISVKIGKDILEKLKEQKVHPREPYDDVLRRLLKWEKPTKWRSKGLDRYGISDKPKLRRW